MTFKPNLPTFYLDQSHLTDAFRGASGDAPLLPLGRVVERIAREANLCLQVMHLHELAAWGDQGAANAMAAWLEGLNPVWTDLADRARQGELRNALLLAVNPLLLQSYTPFIGGLADVYAQWSPEGARFVAHSPLTLVLGATRNKRIGFDRMAELSMKATREYAVDRALALRDGHTRERVDRTLYARARRHRADALYTEHQVLVRFEDRDYRTASGNSPSAAEFSQLLTSILPTPKLMPAWFVRDGIARAFSWRVNVKADPTSQKFRKKFKGSAVDSYHAEIGAAYSDVFTCDQLTHGDLQGVRERLGFAPALAGESTIVAKSLQRELDRLRP
jgi:hypothetical protein